MTTEEREFLDASYALFVARETFNRESCQAVIRTRRQSFDMREKYEAAKDAWEVAFGRYVAARRATPLEKP